MIFFRGSLNTFLLVAASKETDLCFYFDLCFLFKQMEYGLPREEVHGKIGGCACFGEAFFPMKNTEAR